MIIQDLVVGRGELHLNLFEPGTKTGKGERYLGNTPGFTLSVREEAIERKGLSHGLKVITERHVTERSYGGDLIADQMSIENLALWFGSDSKSETVAATGGGPVIVENFVVTKGLSYQLGMTANPLGHRNVNAVVFKLGSTPIIIPQNAVLDAARGRFTVLKEALDIADDATLTVEYKLAGYTRKSAKTARRLEGSMRFIAFNFVGRNTDMFFPYVSIEPKGAIDLKTSDWQNIQFTITLLSMLGREPFYIGSSE